ncbi:CAP domain-containing protein [Natronorubrum bangense]|uniref:SCP domain-containing protein n=2 Tax=Natronorubrum bangense TaxID=61858 RepID=L9WHW5_9EURY|nr:CAP domain-containing protein [Natronorubrum bangense]ELY47948.1 hypothetical protein C494_12140 [Natronorubrum bangense JCM 10635]QCC53588.1 CAP domain-containing protein [Natronorubrum bangense]
MIAVLVGSAVGVGAATPGAAGSHSYDDTDDWVVDVSTLTPFDEERSITTEDQSTATDTMLSIQHVLNTVFSSVFDMLDTKSVHVDDDDSSEVDTEPEADSSESVEDGSDGERDDTADEESHEDKDDSSETDDSSDSDTDDDSSETDDSNESVADETDDTDGDDAGDEHTGVDGDESDTDAGDADDDTGADDADGSDADTLEWALVEQYIHEGINEERTTRGLEALEFDEDLQEIARGHSEDMAERGYFSHTDPEGNAFADRYAEHGYECRAYTDGGTYYIGGENIAYTYVDQPVQTDSGDVVRHTTERELADGLVEQWMNSDEHRENILADHWNNEGIGIAVTDNDRVYATQNFC